MEAGSLVPEVFESGDQQINEALNNMASVMTPQATKVDGPTMENLKQPAENLINSAEQTVENLTEEYKQLAKALAQEAKQKIDSEENFVYSLSSNGVEYVELRLLDLNPFTPLGINEDQIRFLDIFLLFCLLTESPKDDEKKLEDNAFNYNATIFNGREKGIILRSGAKEKPLKTWANEILAQLLELAKFLDRIEN